MKNLFILCCCFVLNSCGDSSPPFLYEQNSRFIIEGVLVNDNNQILSNQEVNVFSTKEGSYTSIKRVYSDANGTFFISIPTANYSYAVVFLNKKIVSMQRNSELIQTNSTTNQNAGLLANFNTSYYDLGLVKLINN